MDDVHKPKTEGKRDGQDGTDWTKNRKKIFNWFHQYTINNSYFWYHRYQYRIITCIAISYFSVVPEGRFIRVSEEHRYWYY